MDLRPWAIASAFTLAGCTAALGATGSQTLGSAGVSSVGAKAGGRLYIWGDDGVVIGAEEEVLARTDTGGCCDQWRVRGLLGVANEPMAHESPIGWEAAVHAGLARIPVDMSHATAAMFGLQGALPIRISPRKDAWDADDLIRTAFQIVPDLTLSELVPLVRAGVRADVAVGLSLRMHFYSGALP